MGTVRAIGRRVVVIDRRTGHDNGPFGLGGIG